MRTLVCLLILSIVAVASATASESPVFVRLRDVSVVQARTVTVGDVAEVSGGLPQLRDLIARLDLTEVPIGKPSVELNRKQLEFRVALAGVPATAFRVDGPPSAQINLKQVPVRADEVVAVARQALLTRLPWKPEEVLVELAQPVLASLPAVTGGDDVSIKAELHPGHGPVGRVQMDVRISARGRDLLALPVYFDVRPYQKVVRCLRRIEKGEALDERNTTVEDQPVGPHSKLALSLKALSGAVARHPLLPGHVVQFTDIEPTGTGGPAVVRTQEAVKIQVRVGGLRVTAAGQALQEGRQGQLIRVQNVDSRKVVLGRVVGPGLVEVE